MERIEQKETGGISANALHTWGMLFLALGIIGKGVFQNQLLGMVSMSTQELLAAMSDPDMMMFATIGLLMQALETCAIPIFSFLLAQGWEKTRDRKAYFLRVLGVAILSELPYNLTMGGKLLDFGSRNPVFGLILSMAVLYFYGSYQEKSLKHWAVRAVVTVAAVLWSIMLKVEYGGAVVIIVVMLWLYRKKPMMRNVAGMAASMTCMLYSPLFLMAPMGMLAVHFYNGEKGPDNRLVNYLAYPAALLAVALVGQFIL